MPLRVAMRSKLIETLGNGSRPRMKYPIIFALAALLFAADATAKRPQILPEPMLVNLFALTEASAALQICMDSNAYSGLPANQKSLLNRLQGNINSLVQKIARKYDEDLFPFFEQSRNEAAKRPERIKTMQEQFAYCGNGMLERMKRYVFDSRQKLDYFLSQQPNAR